MVGSIYLTTSMCIVLCIVLIGTLFVPIHGYGGIQHHSTVRTLFTDAPHVTELHYDTLTSTISNSDTMWAVVFYASWCGGCQRFAPIWKSLSENIAGWSGIVKVASVACSHPENEQLCSPYVVSYPTIRFYAPYHSPTGAGALGEEYAGIQSVRGIRRGIVDFIQETPVRPPHWPHLNTINRITDVLPNGEKRSLLFIDEDENYSMDSYVSREVILDLSDYMDTLLVSRTSLQIAENFAIIKAPSLYEIRSDATHTKIAGSLDRDGYRKLIMLQILGISPTGPTDISQTLHTTTTIQPIPSHSVHSQDLESSLYYTLFHQVSTIELLEGENLDTLKMHLRLVTHLLPIERKQTLQWLTELSNWLNGKERVTNKEWTAHLDASQTHESHIPERVLWVGCLGTVGIYRGYPCSLWIIFHTLTIAVDDDPNAGFTPMDVLQNMRTFIKHFFLCEECSQNFANESADLDSEVLDSKSAILWLWNLHNRVNARLHGDITEDPGYPKKQFPTPLVCTQCYLSGDNIESEGLYEAESNMWNQDQVYSYLYTFYHKSYIVNDTYKYQFVEHHENAAIEEEYSYDSGYSSPVPNNIWYVMLACIFIFNILWY